MNDAAPATTAGRTPPATTPATRTARLPRVVFLGDSITAGFGVDADQAFPALIEDALAREGFPVDVVNAGTSGDTTAGGLARLDWLLQQKPDILVVGLGGNDGLRGQDVKASEANLRAIVTRARDAGARVLLLGMMMPPNYGPEYTAQFRAIYPRLAEELNVPLVPFLLEGVGGEAHLNQRDGIHPTVEGHERIAAHLLPHVLELLQEMHKTEGKGQNQKAQSAS
ncbi:MAG TPA: arylesterase [Tepidisphaeraceae bacterium]|nr:arylesterase [Tepidisphaeraceae bacterium]